MDSAGTITTRYSINMNRDNSNADSGIFNPNCSTDITYRNAAASTRHQQIRCSHEDHRQLHSQKTCVNSIIQPNYEPQLIDLHLLFTDLYVVQQYQSPEPDSDPIPLVYCKDTSALLQRLAELHRRQVRIIYHSCDAGGGFTKFYQSIEFETPPTDNISDQAR